MTLPVPAQHERGTRPYTYAEAFLALGPQAIGDTRDNLLSDLIGRVWLLILTHDRELHLYQRAETGGTWERVTDLLPPIFDDVQPDTRRRYSIAFDQSARAVVAYEDAGTIYLTRWDATANEYVQNVTVAGYDPVVVFDATWSYYVPDSDVLLFYLDAATRSTLQCRVQRDLYLIEYEMHDYGQAVVLDRVTRLPLRYQVLASDEVGDPLTDEGGRVGLLSDLYPVRVADQAAVPATVMPANRFTSAYPADIVQHITAAPAPVDASHVEVITERTPSDTAGITPTALDAAYTDTMPAWTEVYPESEGAITPAALDAKSTLHQTQTVGSSHGEVTVAVVGGSYREV